MARSYKEPIITQGYGKSRRKYAKRAANKSVRAFKGELPFGNWFKRLYQSWDICDWKFFIPKDDETWHEKSQRK